MNEVKSFKHDLRDLMGHYIVINGNLAALIGLHESMLYKYIREGLHENSEYCEYHGYEIMGGKRWLRMTTEEWLDYFPFFSEKEIYKALRSLKKLELIISFGYEEFVWYSINRPNDKLTEKEGAENE